MILVFLRAEQTIQEILLPVQREQEDPVNIHTMHQQAKLFTTTVLHQVREALQTQTAKLTATIQELV